MRIRNVYIVLAYLFMNVPEAYGLVLAYLFMVSLWLMDQPCFNIFSCSLLCKLICGLHTASLFVRICTWFMYFMYGSL